MAHSSGSSESLKTGLIDFAAGSLGKAKVFYMTINFKIKINCINKNKSCK